VALEAETDLSCAATRTPRARLHALLALPIRSLLLLLASSRCGGLARA